jgi:hypothetical protein
MASNYPPVVTGNESHFIEQQIPICYGEDMEYLSPGEFKCLVCERIEYID